jgi:hypothetical protein
MFIPDLGSGFFPSQIRHPDPGIKKALDPGSGSATLPETKYERMNKNGISWRANITSFVAFLCCELC